MNDPEREGRDVQILLDRVDLTQDEAGELLRAFFRARRGTGDG